MKGRTALILLGMYVAIVGYAIVYDGSAALAGASGSGTAGGGGGAPAQPGEGGVTQRGGGSKTIRIPRQRRLSPHPGKRR